MSESHTPELGFSALVPLDAGAALSASAIGRAFAASSPRVSLAIEERPPGDSLAALGAVVDGQRLICALFDGPAPEPDTTSAARQSVFWRAAAQEMEGHGSFLFVAAHRRAAGGRAARAQAAALTRLLGALAETLPARAVHWREADTMSPPGRLIRAARELDHARWPVDAWIGCRVLGNDASAPTVLSLASRGVAPFLGFELEVPPCPAEQKTQALRVLYAAAGALLGSDEPATDGLVLKVRGEKPPDHRLEIGYAGNPTRARLVPVAGGRPSPGGPGAPGAARSGARPGVGGS